MWTLAARLSTRRRTISSCSTGGTSTTPAVPISGSTAWSPSRQASFCQTCSEGQPAGAMGTRACGNRLWRLKAFLPPEVRIEVNLAFRANAGIAVSCPKEVQLHFFVYLFICRFIFLCLSCFSNCHLAAEIHNFH
ncbi:hypothetical protein SKAU_G00263130 [Synaphobranchus kaupii]|uniref:Uncharacterized protein n=1 Tax=Synaphobranchus kaupii TaxID=118154 RepID=A0A9Q1EYN8_SYNKA|nr:hypothetical protein SKAU_G00263130 [Synaphobranchus kaupii]